MKKKNMFLYNCEPPPRDPARNPEDPQNVIVSQ